MQRQLLKRNQPRKVDFRIILYVNKTHIVQKVVYFRKKYGLLWNSKELFVQLNYKDSVQSKSLKLTDL